MPLPAISLFDRVLDKLLEEIALSIEGGDLPVGCALTVDGTLVASHRNTVRSQQGQRFHAERNLLAQLSATALPAGRRVLWVTLEPCLRCARAIQRFGVDEVMYVLDDPFRGGKGLLAQAGITVTRRGEWERDYLGRVMDFYARYPEFCAVRQFGHALTAWQRHQPLGRDEQVKAVFLHHLAPYLPNVPEAQQDEVRRSFLAHVDALVRLTLGECHRVPSPAFIGNLHRALFPPDCRHRAVGKDGVASETGSGDWRRHVLARNYTEFSAPEDIEADLSAVLSRLSAKASVQRVDVLRFFLEFLAVFPFTDGNGRLAAILADVICLNHGLAPLAVDIKNPLFKTALWEDVRGGTPVENQLRLVDGWNRGELGIKPRSIYDVMPSAFQTYARRSGDMQHVVEQIMAKLAGRQLGQHFVVTDIGAGTGGIADGILDGLLQYEGMTLEYHYLEPSQTNMDYYRAHSRHATLPQVIFHTLPVEDLLLPPSDLIVVSQSLQYIPNFQETLRDIVSALKPGGMALVVVTHPTGDEFEMVNRLAPINGIQPRVKAALDSQKIDYEEAVVESLVNIRAADQGTSEGDDLLAFYFRQPARALQPALKEAFWNGVEAFSKAGGIRKKEAFFWLTQRCSEMNSSCPPLVSGPLPPVANGMMASIRHTGSISSDTLRTFGETIEASLRPRLLDTLGKRPQHEHEALISNFRRHVRLLSGYLREELENERFSVNTAIEFHIRLYPPGYMIDAMDNHGSPDKPGNLVKISPGAWRQREILEEPFRNHRWYSVCSPLVCIERDLEKTISALNEIRNPRREDILRFYFLFLKVHPFADSNGTTSAVLADALCARHGLAPLLALNIRFKDKALLGSLCAEYEEVRSEQDLTNLLGKFDAFNQLFPIQGLPALLSAPSPIN